MEPTANEPVPAATPAAMPVLIPATHIPVVIPELTAINPSYRYRSAPYMYAFGHQVQVRTKYLAIAPPDLAHLPSVITVGLRSEFYHAMKLVFEMSLALVVMEGSELEPRNVPETIFNFISCDSIIQRMEHAKISDYISGNPEKFFGQVIGRRKPSTIKIYRLAKYTDGEDYQVIHITYEPGDGTFTIVHSTNNVSEAVLAE